jgi:hypothetical protein
MRPQRGASWTLDNRPAAHFNSRPNVFFPAIILAEIRQSDLMNRNYSGRNLA